MNYSETFFDQVSIKGNVKLLKCWLDSGLELKYTNIAFEFAESPEVLQWWLDSGLKIIYEDLDEYLHNEDIDMLNVWSKSGLPLIFSKNTSPIQSEEIIQWCIKNKVSKKVYMKKK
ncbi:hypothetical protein [Megavirus chiliensis]|uniref:Ankyrin repeat protein n=2 Tax=Megamimivirinae TaxID=3044648 RepID=A0A2L2DP45_MIMIV|nr:hypothetical protein MegaChil _gp1115 [Megavirus chiliensis]AEQ33099.1 hypothetical protein [Megavirus chiliensis]AVG47949.1 ankyrin repeat protein [Acanthamoeba polyphaga mimivirus]